MENNVLEMIKDLQAKKQKLEEVISKIKIQKEENQRFLIEERKRLDDSLKALQEESKNMSEEFNTLAQSQVVSVSLTDLVEELSRLTGISILNMGIDIKFDISCDRIYDLDLLLNNEYSNKDVEILLYGDSSLDTSDRYQPFIYRMTYPINLREKQADGRTFLEHCSRCSSYCGGSDYLRFDKRIGDIICHLNIEQIVAGRRYTWKPISLMTEAMINCIEKGKIIISDEKEKQKTLK